MDTGSVRQKKLDLEELPGSQKTLRDYEKRYLNPLSKLLANMDLPFTIFDGIVRRILHEVLKFQPFKLEVVQKLNPRNFISR